MAVTIEGESIEIVDAHTHMGTRPQREQWKSQASDPKLSKTFFAKLDISEMLQKMSDAGIDAAVTFPMGGFSTEYDYADQNDQIADAMRNNPGKILGFCRINPNM